MAVAELKIQQMVLKGPLSGFPLNLTLVLQNLSLTMLAEVMKDVLLFPGLESSRRRIFEQYKNIMV